MLILFGIYSTDIFYVNYVYVWTGATEAWLQKHLLGTFHQKTGLLVAGDSIMIGNERAQSFTTTLTVYPFNNPTKKKESFLKFLFSSLIPLAHIFFF